MECEYEFQKIIVTLIDPSENILMIDWLTDFNDISTRLGLFYSVNVRVYIFCCCLFIIFVVARSPIKYIKFLNWSIWPINGTLTDTTTRGQSGSGSNDNKKILSGYSDLQNFKPHHQM